MSAATPIYDFFLLKHDASNIRLTSTATPLTGKYLHDVHGFGKSVGSEYQVGIMSISTSTGMYIIWGENNGPANPVAIQLFKKFTRKNRSDDVKHAVATGHVAISFHKYSYDGTDFDGFTKQKVRQIPLPVKTLKEFINHINESKPLPTTREGVYEDYHKLCLWEDDCDHELQEIYLNELVDQMWAKIQRTHARSNRTAAATYVESCLQAAVAAWQAFDREEAAAAAAPPAPQPPSTFLAKLAADSALRTDNKCPIGLEPLASYPIVLVPLCGHVCGPDAASLDKCPVCRTPTAWTEVATSASSPPSI